MNERYLRWYTPHLSRDFEMLVFGNGGGLPLVLFPTSFGQLPPVQGFRPRRRLRAISSTTARSRFIAPTRSISKASTTSPFTRPIGCGPITPTRTSSSDDVLDFARREANCHRVAVCGASLGAYHAGEYRFPASRSREPFHQHERVVRHQRFFQRLPRREHLFQQPLPISSEHARYVEVQSHGRSSSAPANGITPGTKASA